MKHTTPKLVLIADGFRKPGHCNWPWVCAWIVQRFWTFPKDAVAFWFEVSTRPMAESHGFEFDLFYNAKVRQESWSGFMWGNAMSWLWKMFPQTQESGWHRLYVRLLYEE